jgi:hypothetical protein
VKSAPPRTPNYLRFIVTGAVIGFLGGAIFAMVGGTTPDYSSVTQIGFFGVTFGSIGALLAAVVAVLLERRP